MARCQHGDCDNDSEIGKFCLRHGGPLPDGQNEDPWSNRSNNMKCKTCMWFVAKKRVNLTPGIGYNTGICRRHSPSMSGYPVVFVNDWCGDHKLDENKVVVNG